MRPVDWLVELYDAHVSARHLDHRGGDRPMIASARRASRANRRGVMCNLDDRFEDLEAGLARVFASHEVRTVGSMVLFSAQTPV